VDCKQDAVSYLASLVVTYLNKERKTRHQVTLTRYRDMWLAYDYLAIGGRPLHANESASIEEMTRAAKERLETTVGHKVDRAVIMAIIYGQRSNVFKSFVHRTLVSNNP
jgi:hypothetical protein